MVSVTVAITPFETVFVLMPERIHMELPGALSQKTLLPAVDAAKPVVTIADVKSVVEYVKFH